ncbi:MAG: dethiobiotin synthase [Gammaproteobacteria bacterium]|nr:dethiobiotin synthase [Gammaproteobacteria bacterium]
MQQVVVAGIGTGVGKTLVAAILVEALGADYWKPVQAGELDATDTMTVSALTTPGRGRILPEAYRLSRPESPHAAAAAEGVEIEAARLALPVVDGPLVVELAGGVLVPLGGGLTNADLLIRWSLPVVLVSSYYLGSINHTLLSVEALTARGIAIAGLVFNGDPVAASRAGILALTGLPVLLDLPALADVTAEAIRSEAGRLTL